MEEHILDYSSGYFMCWWRADVGWGEKEGPSKEGKENQCMFHIYAFILTYGAWNYV